MDGNYISAVSCYCRLTSHIKDAKTRPYKSDFSADSIPQMGASIAAFNVQAAFRGYRLIGCVAAGFNAIFLRNDIAPDAFPTLVQRVVLVSHLGLTKTLC